MTGEAAGLAMGLVELGSKSATAIEDMVAYAQESLSAQIQGDPYGRGKDYVDIKFKVPSQAWVAGQPYS